MTTKHTITNRIVSWTLVLTSLFTVTFLSSQTSSALDQALLDMFAQNNILFYEPCASVSSSAGVDVIVSGNTVEEKIWNGLTSIMTEEQAAGIMGNIAHEGILNPIMHEIGLGYTSHDFDMYTDASRSYGVGLIGWSFDRRVGMLTYVLQNHPELKTYFDSPETYAANYSYNGAKVYDVLKSQLGDAQADTVMNNLLALELSYLATEMNNSVSMHLDSTDWSEYFSITDVEEAAIYFLYNVEKPANPEASRAERIADAKKYYEQFHGTASGSSPSCNIKGGRDLNKTALTLAWETGGHDPWNDPKPAYTTALADTGINQLGDRCSMNGNSCDAFVTTVIRYSGVDPDIPCCGAANVHSYLLSHPEKYDRIANDGTDANLQPGDILSNDGHIMMFVKDANGNSRIASASHCERTGELSDGYISSSYQSEFDVFRAKGNIYNGGGTGNCDACSGIGGGIVSGGMTMEEAEEFMTEYRNLPSSEWTKYGLSGYDCLDGPVANCVSFSKYFINKYTTVHVDGVGNGGDVVNNLISTYGFEDGGTTPQVYAVFSTAGGSTMCGATLCGHTGVVLGIDEANDKIIIGEAGCSASNSWTGAHEYSLSAYSSGAYIYAYTNGKLVMGN